MNTFEHVDAVGGGGGGWWAWSPYDLLRGDLPVNRQTDMTENLTMYMGGNIKEHTLSSKYQEYRHLIRIKLKTIKNKSLSRHGKSEEDLC